MKEQRSRSVTDRRGRYKFGSVAGFAAVGRNLLVKYVAWLNVEDQAARIRAPFNTASSGMAQMLELVRYATLAANSHNAQPWQFAINEKAIEMYPDYTRRLPVVDPNDRELWISLGCALENLLIATCACGYAAEVTYPEAIDFIQTCLTADSPQHSPLFDAIPLRQNTRSEYSGQPIKNEDLSRLQALPLEPGVRLHFVTAPGDLETVLAYVNQGAISQFADKAFVG